MARREYYYSPVCVHDGCAEHAHYVFGTRADQRAEMDSLRRRGGWRCSRHSEPDEVLSAESPTRTRTLIASRSPKYDLPGRLFWIEEGGENGSGFTYGPGFRAFAKDFPEGTRLTVTASVRVPASAAQEKEPF